MILDNVQGTFISKTILFQGPRLAVLRLFLFTDWTLGNYVSLDTMKTALLVRWSSADKT